MKVILLLAVLVLAIWLWRSGRDADAGLNSKRQTASPEPLEMIGCTLCGVHFPRADGLQGRNGVYCCHEHRQRAES